MWNARESTHESNRRFYDRIARAYDFIADTSERTVRQRGEELLALEPGERVLEIGFGTGNGVLELARLVGVKGHVAGIDISEGMAAVAERKVAEERIATPVDLRIGDARRMPFGDGVFDAAFTSFTLELFPAEDFAAVLGEIRRVLKPRGRLGVVSMTRVRKGEHESLMEQAYKWFHRHFPHIVDCRPIDPAAVLRTHGFEVTAEDRIEIWSLPVAAVVGVIR